MATSHYLALLRGINVGGNNLIKMVDLKACFEEMGLTDVRTYIQSGNVIFKSEEKDIEKLTAKIETYLTKTLNYHGRTVVISDKMLKQIIKEAPKGFGEKPDLYRYDVIFLKPPMTAKEAIEEVKIRRGVDQVYAGEYVLYFSRLISKATSSKISRIIQMPIYQFMTIRNWNTTTKLRELMKNKIKTS